MKRATLTKVIGLLLTLSAFSFAVRAEPPQNNTTQVSPAPTVDIMPDLFSNPSSSPATVGSGFTPSDDFDNIEAQVDTETRLANSPSPLVNYSPSNDRKYDAADYDSSAPVTMSNALNLVNVLTKIPFSDEAKGIRVYLSLVKPEMIGKHLGQASQGLRTYFSDEISGNTCVQNRAIDFYTQVGNAIKDLPLIGRPTVLDSVKSDSHGRLKPGWIWKTALQASGGDAGLALTLIGMCGHDDHDQSPSGGSFGFRSDTETARHAIANEIDRYASIKSDLVQQVGNKPTVKSKALLSTIDRKVSTLKSSHGFASISCPVSTSPFFAPGSLGSSADIPPDLKQEIVQTQNPDGVLTIPAKYYHVYASAFITCKMIENGIDPEKAKGIVKQGAKMYRGIRLCEELSENVVYSVPGYSTAEVFLESPEATRKCRQAAFKNANANVCGFSDQAEFYKRRIKNPAELRKKIDSMFLNADASYLYRLWFVGEKYMGFNYPCSDRRKLGGLAGPRDLMKNDSDADPNSSGFNYHTPRKPLSWTNARYENAKRKIATWLVDTKWTVAQHEVGANFAAQSCKQRPAEESLEQAACRIDGRKTRSARGTKAIK